MYDAPTILKSFDDNLHSTYFKVKYKSTFKILSKLLLYFKKRIQGELQQYWIEFI